MWLHKMWLHEDDLDKANTEPFLSSIPSFLAFAIIFWVGVQVLMATARFFIFFLFEKWGVRGVGGLSPWDALHPVGLYWYIWSQRKPQKNMLVAFPAVSAPCFSLWSLLQGMSMVDGLLLGLAKGRVGVTLLSCPISLGLSFDTPFPHSPLVSFLPVPVLHFLSVCANYGDGTYVLQVPGTAIVHTVCCAFFPLDSFFSPGDGGCSFFGVDWCPLSSKYCMGLGSITVWNRLYI